MTYTGPSLATPKPAWFVPAAMGRPFEASTDDLVKGLFHPAQSVRLVAQRRLAERKAEAELTLETRDEEHSQVLIRQLADAGYTVRRLR